MHPCIPLRQVIIAVIAALTLLQPLSVLAVPTHDAVVAARATERETSDLTTQERGASPQVSEGFVLPPPTADECAQKFNDKSPRSLREYLSRVKEYTKSGMPTLEELKADLAAERVTVQVYCILAFPEIQKYAEENAASPAPGHTVPQRSASLPRRR